MNVLAWILGIVLAAGFGGAGLAKLLDIDRMRDHLGYTKRQYRGIGISELAGAAGVIVGLLRKQLEWLGVSAAFGICVLMLGALMAHARVDDEGKKIIPAVVMLAVAIAYMITISLR